ncbi:MAG: hypothetical protein C4309_01995, partial [Chloroflexota bacterium]
MEPIGTRRNSENAQHPPGKGQSFTEFAMTLPLLLILLFAIIEAARVFQAWLTVENAARAAARYGVTGEYNPAHCMAGCTTEADQDQARMLSMKDVARAAAAGIWINDAAGPG